MQFDFKFPKGHTEHRGAYRTRVPGLAVVVCGTEHRFNVRDLSATGVAFDVQGADHAVPDGTAVDLMLLETPVLKGVRLELVRRFEERFLACRFRGLTRRQEANLDKLILEVQKRIISLRKANETNL